MNAPAERRILVVDDDVPILEAISDLLRSEGYVVREEPESERAVQSAREFQPDLVLLDLMMPTLDGLAVAHGLRNEPQTSEVPLVLMTASPDAQRVATQMDATSFLCKPFSARALLRAVRGDSSSDRTNPEITV